MNTFLEMRNYVLNVYREVLSENRDNESSSDIDEDSDDEESELDIFGIIPEKDLEIATIVTDNILALPEDELNSFIRLIVLYYMIINLSIMNLDDLIDNDDLIELIVNEDINYVIGAFKDQSSGYLFDLVNLIIEEDIKSYGEDVLLEEGLTNYNYFSMLNDAIENDNIMVKLFSMYHPNIEEEKKDYQKYTMNENIVSKYSKRDVKSLGEFITLFTFIKDKITNNYCVTFLYDFLDNIFDANKKVYNDIIVFILKYYYVCSCVDKCDSSCIRFEVLDIIQELREDGKVLLDDSIIKEFSKFDFNKYMSNFDKLSKEDMYCVNELSAENIELYGNDGKWIEYRQEDMDRIFKYSPSWFPIDLSDNSRVEIYYTEDKNGEFTIPRICLVMDKNGKLVDIYGRSNGVCIEFELLDILNDRVKVLSNYDEIKSSIYDLKILSNINNKIKNSLDLCREEIDFLYEINSNFSKSILTQNDDRFNDIKEDSNLRRDLAIYFNCLDSEVALSEKELNSNTVVTTRFYPRAESCNYPKLKAIFGTAYGTFLKNAKGLSSLEYIKGNAYFGGLNSVCGLESLKRVDGNLYFGVVGDINHLNTDLVVMGEVDINHENVELGKMKKKRYDN